jgi:hypothetical protein
VSSNLVLAYVACGGLIVVYALGRFNTPSSNRSSTRQALYWSSCLGYVLSALALFAALSILLQSGPWRSALLGPADQPTLPVPLIATLALTTLLPSIPVLRRVDEWLLSVFLDWAEIPAEVKRRAAAMTPQSFAVTKEDVAELRETYGDNGCGERLACHLVERGGEGFQLSLFRFTRVVKLYDRVCKLAGEPRYARFFAEADKEFTELDRQAADFLRRSAASLTIAERLRALEEKAAYEELIRERREAFGQSCRDMFRALALFLARAVLRSEASERGIIHRLRAIGFIAAEPMNLPPFPINSLTVLALGVFLYFALAILFLGDLMGMRQDKVSGLMVAAKVALVRLVTIGVTVWLMQRHGFFHRAPGEPPRFFAYAVNGVIAAVVAAGICLLFHSDADPLTAVGSDLPLILLSFMLCGAVALCCDDWVEDASPPAWLRAAEAAGCASVMVLGMGMVYFYLGNTLPFPTTDLAGWKIALLVGFPSAMALIIGGCVPHIYRSARRAAMARRNEASHPHGSAARIPVPAGNASTEIAV